MLPLLLPYSISDVLNKVQRINVRFFYVIVTALMATSGLAAPAPDGEVANINTVADGKFRSHAYKIIAV
ncbi:hypothetical protein PspLS_08754 [Pyricularia sp. CBS 133598]|nr:hypothetical protein PspLS_08754 [Pyricularia sp. CBS 133598]